MRAYLSASPFLSLDAGLAREADDCAPCPLAAPRRLSCSAFPSLVVQGAAAGPARPRMPRRLSSLCCTAPDVQCGAHGGRLHAHVHTRRRLALTYCIQASACQELVPFTFHTSSSRPSKYRLYSHATTPETTPKTSVRSSMFGTVAGESAHFRRVPANIARNLTAAQWRRLESITFGGRSGASMLARFVRLSAVLPVHTWPCGPGRVHVARSLMSCSLSCHSACAHCRSCLQIYYYSLKSRRAGHQAEPEPTKERQRNS